MYSNAFFDLTLEFPKDWIPHGEATSQRLVEVGNEKLKSLGSDTAAATKVAEWHRYDLLAVFENELGTPGIKFFRSEMLTADDETFAPGVKTGKDFLLNGVPILKKLGYQTFSEITPVEIQGITFYREDVSRRVNSEITLYQTFFCTVIQRYALSLAITTEDVNATRKLADDVLALLSFRSEGKEFRYNSVPVFARSARDWLGEFRSLYHNSYFDLNYRVPEGWFVDTSILRGHLSETKTAVSDPKKTIITLLAANEFAPGTPGVQFDPMLAITAYSNFQNGRVMTAQKYLAHVTLAAKKFEHAELIQQSAEVSIGSRKFYRADCRRSDKGYKSVVCTEQKGNIIAWTFVARSQSQMDELIRSLQSISFSKAR